MKKLIVLLVLCLTFSCVNTEKNVLIEGNYIGLIETKDHQQLPFNFKVTSANTLEVYNAEEVIEVYEITYRNDSVYIKMPVFEGYLSAKISNNQTLNGFFIKESEDRITKFSAHIGSKRFKTHNEEPTVNVDGIWETVFSKHIADDEYMAKAIFKQDESKVTGTFRTTTGDYRYLEGIVDGDSLKLSTFDGAHAFLFLAKVSDSMLNGIFYSGNHWKEPFEATRNPSFELTNANELTYLKEGYDSFNFSFPNSEGNYVSLRNDQFHNKVVVVQIMGTWCPNCLDESKYYANFYNENKNEDLEFVALAFEYAKTEQKAFDRINRLKEKIDISYPILLAQYGSSSKEKAQEKLPMLNHVLSYPTTIFIDKKGNVRKIHTGFNGPATGDKYTEFIEEFETFVDSLLAE
ncbi:MAG: TlpA family protein disulfide reductase [Winogradskyella sp.]|nr:TlpA family protein disulfide reductase [Winogradskyella sp.]